ncbi:MAG: SHOCT domain-containing protein [Gemmatimonadales bacterium]|nr:SHOCT domain-containing protein [Gemmatimonadales bacterium]
MGATPAQPAAPVELSPGLDAIQSLLIPGERLESHAVQRRIFALTHRRIVVGATSGRLIAVSRGLVSGFTVQDIRWQDLRDAQLQVGIFGATLSVSADAGDDLAGAVGTPRGLSFAGLRKDQAHEVYRACQFQEQAWREKRRVRELEELRAKSGGVHLSGAGVAAGGGDDAGRSPQARLNRAKEMLDQGLLTDAEYEQVKARILGEL